MFEQLMCALHKYRTRLRDQVGATMVEYALIVAAIALVVVGGAVILGDAIFELFDTAADEVGNTPG